MKKVIIAIVFIIATSVVNFGQTTDSSSQDRLRVEVRGFNDNVQALLVISQYLQNKAKWAVLVQANPDYIMRITNTQGYSRSWTGIDYKARGTNNAIRSGEQALADLLRSMPGKGRAAGYAKQAGYGMAQGQLQRFYKPEQYQFQELRADVVVEILDVKSRQVVSRAIGVNTIVVKTAREYGQEPVTLLSEGDLTSVGVTKVMNLGNAYKQLLQLSAFMNATLPENNIVKQ